jgi:hypothetical protein
MLRDLDCVQLNATQLLNQLARYVADHSLCTISCPLSRSLYSFDASAVRNNIQYSMYEQDTLIYIEGSVSASFGMTLFAWTPDSGATGGCYHDHSIPRLACPSIECPWGFQSVLSQRISFQWRQDEPRISAYSSRGVGGANEMH